MNLKNLPDKIFRITIVVFALYIIGMSHGLFRDTKDTIPFYYYLFPEEQIKNKVSDGRLMFLNVFHIGLIGIIIMGFQTYF